jgi:hypothetical protein
MRFAPKAKATVSLAATAGSATVPIRSHAEDGGQVLIFNAGSSKAFIEIGGAAVAATVPNGPSAGSMVIPTDGWAIVTQPGTHLAAICAAGESATLYAVPGVEF